MKKALAAFLVMALASPAAAWEPQTTQAGLAEQAALASRLHDRLVELGFSGGLFEALTIPPADAPALMQALKLLSPTHGTVPDARGRQSALSWIAAGAALADIPATSGANHFYDPSTGRGWSKPDRDVVDAVSDKVRQAIGRAALPAQGVPAPDWVVAKDNPFNVEAFYAQYAKAVTAGTPGERSRHMAAALVAAGAILHTLGDLGAPARVRGDLAAQLEPLGGGPDDLGSRFERIAALAYGRLGVPAPARVITRTKLREFFTAVGAPAPTPATAPVSPTTAPADGKAAPKAPTLPALGPVVTPAVEPMPGEGLANFIARSYFSPNTLPAPTRMSDDAAPVLARPSPSLPTRLNLMSATRDAGTTLRNSSNTCLARYGVESNLITFTLDDDCMLEQVTAILPEVASYQTGLLQFLLRGEVTVAVDSSITISGTNLAAGTLTIVAEDLSGVRTIVANVNTAATTGEDPVALAKIGTPANAERIYAMYRGTDAAGEPIVAVGAQPRPDAAPTTAPEE